MTTMVMSALIIFGIAAYFTMPTSELPNVDFPTIEVEAALPGADPQTMASAVATPLEQQFSAIAGLSSMNSDSSTGSTKLTLQFDLSRNIDAAAQDVQAAISQSMRHLPPNMPSLPVLHKENPSDSAVIYLALSSKQLPITKLDDYAETRVAQQLSTISGVAQVLVFGSQKYAVRIELDPYALAARNLSLAQVDQAIQSNNTDLPTGTLNGSAHIYNVQAEGQLLNAAAYNQSVIAYRNGAPVRLTAIGTVQTVNSGAVHTRLDSQITQVFVQDGQRRRARSRSPAARRATFPRSPRSPRLCHPFWRKRQGSLEDPQ